MKAICLIGLQCAGKSTLCEEYKKQGYNILSSDALRLIQPDWTNQEVFDNLYKNMESLLKDGHNVVLDATNMTMKSRKSFVDICNRFENVEKEAIIVNTPYIECLKRLRLRNASNYPNKVPEEALYKYYLGYQMPTYDEGFDVIKLAFKHSYDTNKITESWNFRHNDNWHGNETVYAHACHIVALYIRDDALGNKLPLDLSTLQILAFTHDYGKYLAAKPKPNDPTKLRYHNHGNIGAWELGCLINSTVLPNMSEDYLILVNACYHMDIMDMKQTTLDKYFGKELQEKLLYFSKLDKESTAK